MSADTKRLRLLIDRYWDCAYQEGLESRDHDTEDGLAQKTRDQIEDIINKLESKL